MPRVIDLTGRESLLDLLSIAEEIRDQAWSSSQIDATRCADELALEIEREIGDTERRYDFTNVADIAEFRREYE